MLSLIYKNLFKTIFLISLIALISAYFIEHVLGHQPCNLCLLERIPYFFSIIIIILNLKFNHFEKFFIFLLIIVFLGATLLSLYHFGIEQDLIQESLVCDLQNGSEALSKEEMLKQLQQKSVSCKDVTFKIFGLSLTTINIIISCLITIILIKMYFEYDKNR
jgi:disulfide bond formation protein DsbB